MPIAAAGTVAAGTSAAGGSLLSAINPYVGLATLGIGLATEAFGTGAERRAGERKMGYIGEQQSGIESALGQLGEITGMKTEMAQDIYGTNLGQAMFKTGQDLYGLTRQGQTAAAQTGFASSGQVQSQMQRAQEAGVTSFGFQRQSLQDVLGQKLMDIEEFRGGEEGRLQAEQARLKYEMEEARAQSKKKFLGIF